ncbi:MAG: DMT family transporter, partial [Sneathiella sp.]
PTAALFFVLLSPFLIDFSALDPTAVAVFAGVGFLFPATVTLLTFLANVHMGPSITGAIGNLTPLFAVLLAVFLLDEPFGLFQAIGMLVILGGVTCLTFSRSGATSRWPLWVIILPLGGAVVRGVTQPAIKWGLVYWAEPFAAVTIGYVISALLILSIATIQQRNKTGSFRMERRHPTGRNWFVIVGLTNGVAALLTYTALEKGEVSIVSPLIATYPLVTLILSLFVLRNVVWNIQLVVGVIATVLGVGIILAGS